MKEGTTEKRRQRFTSVIAVKKKKEREREKRNAGVVVSDKFTRETVLVVNFLYL